MQPDNIQEKAGLARQVAYFELSKKPEYKFHPITENVLNQEMKKYMHLSVQQLQSKLNNIPNMLNGNKNKKDGWELMGIHYNKEQKARASQNMKKISTSLHKWLDKKPVPKESYETLSKRAEAKRAQEEEIKEQQKVSKLTPDQRKIYITDKYYYAKGKNDKVGMAKALYEFFEYDCGLIDNKLGITKAKAYLAKASGAQALGEYIDKKVDDGNPNNLSKKEQLWEIIKGIGNTADSFIGTEGLAMGGILGTAGKSVAAIPKIGKIVSGSIQAGFAAQGAEMAYEGTKNEINATTKEEARNASSEASMGLLMFSGGVESAKLGIKEIKVKGKSEIVPREELTVHNEKALNTESTTNKTTLAKNENNNFIHKTEEPQAINTETIKKTTQQEKHFSSKKTGTLLKNEQIYFEGTKLATGKKELLEQMKSQGREIDMGHNTNLDRLFANCKNKSDFQKASMFLLRARSDQYVDENLIKGLKSLKEADIAGLLISKNLPAEVPTIEKIKNNPNLYEIYEQIQVDKNEYNNPLLYVSDISDNIKNSTQKDVVINLIKDKDFDFIYNRKLVGKTLKLVDKPEDIGEYRKLLKTITPRRFASDNEIKNIFSNVDNPEFINLAKTLLEKKDCPDGLKYDIISRTQPESINLTQKLISNKKIPYKDVKNILLSIDLSEKEVASQKRAFTDDLLNNKEFPKDKLAYGISSISSYSPEIAEKQISFAKELIKKEDFPKDKLADITSSISSDSPEIAEKQITFAKELINNKKMETEEIPGILNSLKENSIEQIQTKMDITKRLLNSHESKFPNIVNILKGYSLNEESDKLVSLMKNDDFINKLYDIAKDPRMTAQDFSLLYKFNEYSDKKVLASLSKTEKKQFMQNLLTSKNELTNNHMQTAIPLLPKDDISYEKAMKSISQSLNLTIEPLPMAKQKQFDISLNNLENSLKTMDLSKLEHIQLTMPQSEFVSKVTDLTKGLPKEEQTKIMDNFGFNIQDQKLTGYPNSLGNDISISDINNPKTLQAANKVKDVVNEYTNNNFVTTKDNPALNKQLKEISKVMPEIFNQVDDSKTPVGTIKTLQKVIQNPKYETLSNSDKKVMLVSTLLHNTDKASGSTSESAFDAYFIAKKFNMSNEDAAKVYRIVESSDLINKFMATSKTPTIINTRGSHIAGNDRLNKFDNLAFNLKGGNTFEMAQMLYSAKETEGLTRYLDKALASRIKEIKANDFVLPQTAPQDYITYGKEQRVTTKTGNSYDVIVSNASEIPNFKAFIHTPESSVATGGTRLMNFANFEAFNTFADDKVICTSYVSKNNYGTFNKHGFVFEVKNDKQYVGYGKDMFSLSKNIPDMITEYYRDNGLKANRNRGEKIEHRTMISNEIKGILKISDDEYIKRIENLKQKAGNEALTPEKIKEIDPELYNAYQEFFSRIPDDEYYNKSLLRNNWHNEVLVSNPEIKAIYTKSFDNIPEEYLKKAQEEGLPIVVLK